MDTSEAFQQQNEGRAEKYIRRAVFIKQLKMSKVSFLLQKNFSGQIMKFLLWFWPTYIIKPVANKYGNPIKAIVVEVLHCVFVDF